MDHEDLKRCIDGICFNPSKGRFKSRFVPEQLESGEMTAFLDGVMEG